MYRFNILFKFVTVSLIFYIFGNFSTGVHLDNWGTAFLVSSCLILLNLIIRPILVLITLPLTLITFGLFIYVINTFMILLVSSIIPGFSIESFWWALLIAFAINIVDRLSNYKLDKEEIDIKIKTSKKKKDYIDKDEIIDIDYEEIDKK